MSEQKITRPPDIGEEPDIGKIMQNLAAGVDKVISVSQSQQKMFNNITNDEQKNKMISAYATAFATLCQISVQQPLFSFFSDRSIDEICQKINSDTAEIFVNWTDRLIIEMAKNGITPLKLVKGFTKFILSTQDFPPEHSKLSPESFAMSKIDTEKLFNTINSNRWLIMLYIASVDFERIIGLSNTKEGVA